MHNNQKNNLHVGLLAAMPEELGSILNNLENIEEKKYGNLILYSGSWLNKKGEEIIVTTAWSGWGKVSAARATTRLCGHTFKNKPLNLLLFTGVAGAVKKDLKQWDIILANSVIQHDMDARPIFEQYFIPNFNTDKISPRKKLKLEFLESLLEEKNKGNLEKFGNIYEGLIATGDQFISNLKIIEKLEAKIPELMAVEMEGGSFAQVAEEENIRWLLLRIISDNANDSAENDFNYFLSEYKKVSWKLIETFLNQLS